MGRPELTDNSRAHSMSLSASALSGLAF
jgi:hypothetical protein